MREIITLQLGQRSNYLATHFWNAQESYFTYSAHEESLVDHNVHFRPGIGTDGSETFTPRTVIYDLKGGFGSLRKYSVLYEVEDHSGLPKGLWDGNTAVQRNATIPPNEYQRSLDDGLPTPKLTPDAVRFWSDFNRVYYHPRSIVHLYEYELGSQMMPFEDWSTGEDLFATLDKEHDMIDRDVRPFAEECDQLSGFQIFAGVDDAWGGFGARYVDRLRDEFGKTSIWVWATQDGNTVQRPKQMKREGNSARSLVEISAQSSAYVPILAPPDRLPPYVHLARHSEWSTSALSMTAVETVTLPSRLRGPLESHRSLADLEAVLNVNGHQKIYQLQCAIADEETVARRQVANGDASQTGYPNALPEQDTVGVVEDPATRDESQPTPLATQFDLDFGADSVIETQQAKQPHLFGKVEVRRGEWPEAERDSEQDRGVGQQQTRLGGEPFVEKYHTALKFPLIDSFPHTLFSRPRTPSSASFNVVAALSTTSQVARRVELMRPVVRRAIGLDDREDLLNGLEEIREAYLEGWDSGTDSGEDED